MKQNSNGCFRFPYRHPLARLPKALRGCEAKRFRTLSYIHEDIRHEHTLLGFADNHGWGEGSMPLYCIWVEREKKL